MAAKKQSASFEESLARLDEIVKHLEKGDMPLSESLNLYEEGTALINACSKMLDEAEQNILKLKKSPDRDSEFYTRECISLEILTFSGHVGVSGHRLRLHKSVGTAFSGKISPTVFQRL